MTPAPATNVNNPEKCGIRDRLSPCVLLSAGILFLWLLGMSGCETTASKKNKAPNPLPARAAVQAFQSKQNPSLYTGKSYVAANGNKGTDPVPSPVFAWPQGFERVAALPIYNTTPTGDSLDALDEIFHSELSKVLPLEIIIVSRADLLAALGTEQFASTAVIPQKLIQFLKDKYAVQGIIFTDMPVYRPYRPINIAVRSKLVQIPDMQILWSANGILDSGDPGIAASALQYADRNVHGPCGGTSQVILQSPRRYASFVANGLYGTLPGQAPSSGDAKTPRH